MAISQAQTVLAGAIITASMTFWAIYMALYVFVFRYFLTKEESAKFQRGFAYLKFFVRVEVVSFQAAFTVALAVVALLTENEEPLVAGVALGSAVAIFLVNLVFGTWSVLKEVRTTQEHVFQYAAPEYLTRTLTKAYLKAVRKKAKQLMSKEEGEKFVRDTLDKVVEGIQKSAKSDKSSKDNDKGTD